MLPVRVDLHRALPPAAAREAEPRLQRAADAQVVGELDDVNAGRVGRVDGAVTAAVTDDDDVQIGDHRGELAEHAG